MKDQEFNFQNSTELQKVSMDYAYKKGYKLDLEPPPYLISDNSEGILVVIGSQNGTRFTSRRFLIPFGLNEQEVQNLIDEEIKNFEINKIL
ncbi:MULTISPECIES: hypothetical protein [Bacillus amyloliquefaciens group]|uniref:hypothetical protein n=1 Tax=Bacillus amyloliquefaciens group TaxID=1938374 RepID=UPI000BA55395|nr:MULTISPECIES: hypothetical protein [Bacillus amyloliquefaciens group]MDQ8093937.1 hypothetical protein [Bacillus amyloliquefaciens]PAK31802.1 hypothetical protein CJ467_03000 [Bacillus velezensis]QEV91041.1 hypothetical protein F3129_06310 [Bacillus velezensis]UBQ47608.1 hypothetical protein LCH16_06280 [Bacillus velezensis]